MKTRSAAAVLAWFRRYSFDRYLSGTLLALLTVIAVARALQHVYVVDINEPFQYSLWWHVPFNLFMWWNWFLFVPAIYWTMDRFTPNGPDILRSAMLYAALPTAIIGCRQAAATLVTTLVLADKSDFAGLFYWRLVANPWLWLDLIVYFVILLGLQVVEYRRRSEQSALRKVQLQTQFVRSQLAALRSQLHPHFLFNTLNTVSTLILKEDNAEAERMLSLLNNFLRTTAFESGNREVTLRDELRFIGDYLEIEKVRFSGKLDVRRSIDPATLDALVPGFLLQPIVENAIYHAIAVKASKGVITISSSCDGGVLTLTVKDDGPGFSPAPAKKKRKGVGLAVTRERLDYLYGSGYRLMTSNRPEGGAIVTITLPFRLDHAARQAS